MTQHYHALNAKTPWWWILAVAIIALGCAAWFIRLPPPELTKDEQRMRDQAMCRYEMDAFAPFEACEKSDHCKMTLPEMRNKMQIEMAKQYYCDLAGPEETWEQ